MEVMVQSLLAYPSTFFSVSFVTDCFLPISQKIQLGGKEKIL